MHIAPHTLSEQHAGLRPSPIRDALHKQKSLISSVAKHRYWKYSLN